MRFCDSALQRLFAASIGLLASAGPLYGFADELSNRVRTLFIEKCADCHGSELAKPKGGFGDVEKVESLKANPKYVKRFDPGNSLLYQYLVGTQTPQMPKGDDPLTEAELALVRSWIGVPSSDPPAAARPVVSEEDVIAAVHEDLGQLRPAERGYHRYFSLANLANERLPDGAAESERRRFEAEQKELLETARIAVFKLVNSLSWSPKLVLPSAVDAAGLLWRLDLREMRRDPAGTLSWDESMWELLCERYPYGRQLGVPKEEEIIEWTASRLPVVRADWFVYAASRPPLYHDLLGLPGGDGKPGADRRLEEMLELDVTANILAGTGVTRAGIRDKQSGVSQHNRLIERHGRDDGHYYWKSYDFEASVGEGNLVLHPLGPRGLPGLPPNQREFAFVHAGGEIIFSLPNGLQGYLLVDEKGRRIDDGPAKIVFDRDSSADVVGQITNGISCIACHAGGINPKLDQIRGGALKVLPRGLRDEFEALYPPNDRMAAQQEADKARFKEAMGRLSPSSGGCDETECEPIRRLSLRFGENLTLERAAAEFGVDPDEFKSAFGGRLKALRAQLEAGAVSRAEFIHRFGDLVGDNAAEFGELSGCGAKVSRTQAERSEGVREPIPVPARSPEWAEVIRTEPDGEVIVDTMVQDAIRRTGLPWLVRDRTTGIEMVLIPPGSFQMGCDSSPQGECHGDEIPVHTVTLTNAFYMGRYEVTQAQWKAQMGSNPSYFQSASTQVPAAQVPDRPVEEVSWNTIQGFLTQTGMRLPTEAEWEYAYRAGTTTAFHGFTGYLSGTNDDSLLGNIAWFNGNSNSQTRPVGGRLGNGFGLHDMSGNVREWVNDWYSFSYYSSSPQNNPPGPTTGTLRVVRGGNWSNGASDCCASYRYFHLPTSSNNRLGFRVARNP